MWQTGYLSGRNIWDCLLIRSSSKGKGKAVPLQAWSGPESSRKLRFPDFLTTAQNGGKVVSPTHRPHLPPGNTPGTHFCYRLSRPQGHRAIRRIYVNEKFHNIIWDRNSDLLICSAVAQVDNYTYFTPILPLFLRTGKELEFVFIRCMSKGADSLRKMKTEITKSARDMCKD
jgi:hypothetical protein